MRLALGIGKNKSLFNIFILEQLHELQIMQNKLPPGFEYVDSHQGRIICSLRYLTNQNFVGEKIEGYNKNILILSQVAADALIGAVDVFSQEGYKVVVYDAYRPQKAVAHFLRWAQNSTYNREMKACFLPYVDHDQLFEKKYLAKQSGHTRGSTVDLSIIRQDQNLTPVKISKRALADGREIPFLDDGTVDMGTSFDFLDVSSAPESELVSEEARRMRQYLRSVMEQVGFEISPREWWHFKLINEPFPHQYFDFDVE